MLLKLLYFEGALFVRKGISLKKKSILEFLILLVLASKILQSNCLPYCSHWHVAALVWMLVESYALWELCQNILLIFI